MKHYILLLRVSTTMRPTGNASDLEERYAWLRDLEARGLIVDRGGTMAPIPSMAASVFSDGKYESGPFKDGAYFIVGTLIIQVENLEAAVAIAQTNPIVKEGGSVEIREYVLRDENLMKNQK